MKHKTFHPSLKTLMALLLSVVSMQVWAQTQDTLDVKPAVNDTTLIRAYILYSTPGPLVDETWGHSALRLSVPDLGIDQAYTSVPIGEISEELGAFIAGHSKTHVIAMPIQGYVDRYATQGRGVSSYELQLPLEVKHQIWQQMQERMQQDPQPFDFVRRACAQTTFRWVIDAIDKDSLHFVWSPKFDDNMKELLKDGIPNPWVQLIMDGVMGGETTSTELSHEDRVVVPGDLVKVLQHATAYSQPLITAEPEVLLVQTREEPEPATAFTPFVLMLIWLALLLINVFYPNRFVLYIAWAIQFLLGLFFTYLVFVSDMPGTEWNWLIIPLNPLPVLFWHWRRQWSFPFAIICLVWVVSLMLSPHMIFTLPWFLFVGGVACASFGTYKLSKHRKHKHRH